MFGRNQLLKTDFKVLVFENDTIIVYLCTYHICVKMQICENADIMHVLWYVCSVSLQNDIAIYWSGMHNAAFLVVFADLSEQG